jgi:hypothetical protein
MKRNQTGPMFFIGQNISLIGIIEESGEEYLHDNNP